MAWFTEQYLADFLNKCEDFSILKKEISEIMSDDVIMHYGTMKYCSKAEVIGFLEEIASAISSESGFYAMPVIICDIEDLEQDIHLNTLRKAVALHSQLEEYISWFFMIKCNENFEITRIDATQGVGYKYYEDIYNPQKYATEETNE